MKEDSTVVKAKQSDTHNYCTNWKWIYSQVALEKKTSQTTLDFDLCASKAFLTVVHQKWLVAPAKASKYLKLFLYHMAPRTVKWTLKWLQTAQ